MNVSLKRILSTFMLVFMVAGVFAMLGTQQVHAAKKYKLPSKVVCYDFGSKDENGKVTPSVTKYKYDKKGNVYKRISDGFVTKYKNKYKKGKLVSSCFSTGGPANYATSTRYFNSKGRPVKDVIRYYNTKGKVYEKQVTKIKTNKKGYITKYIQKEGTTKNRITYYKNGMPKVIKDNYGETIKFDKQGRIVWIKIVTAKTWDALNGYEDPKTDEIRYYRISYKKKNGKLIAIKEYKVSGGNWPQGWGKETKYVYTMGPVKTKEPRRYAAMMSAEVEYLVDVMPELIQILGNG